MRRATVACGYDSGGNLIEWPLVPADGLPDAPNCPVMFLLHHPRTQFITQVFCTTWSVVANFHLSYSEALLFPLLKGMFSLTFSTSSLCSSLVLAASLLVSPTYLPSQLSV